MSYSLKNVLLITAAWTCVVYVMLALIASQSELFLDSNFLSNFHMSDAITFWTPWQTWDAQGYLQLAQQWYGAEHGLHAYYPLFPALIFAIQSILPVPHLVIGFFIVNVCFFASVILLYQLVQQRFGDRTAFWSVVMLQAFPTAFFFHLFYTESLFLFLILLLFWGLQKQKLRVVIIAALLLPLARAQGVLLIVPTLYVVTRKWNSSFNTRKRFVLYIVAGFGAGFLLYLGIMYASTGSISSGFDAQQLYTSQYSIQQLFHPLQWLANTWGPQHWSLAHLPGNSSLDRVWCITFVLLLIGIYKTLPREWFIFTALVGLITAFSGNLMSFPRFTLPLFPLAVFIAVYCKRNTCLAITAVFLSASQLALLIMHARNMWVA